MELALDTGKAWFASHKVDLCGSFIGVYVKRRFWGLIPYWHCLRAFDTLDEAEAWLQAHWKLPNYFHVTRKTPA